MQSRSTAGIRWSDTVVEDRVCSFLSVSAGLCSEMQCQEKDWFLDAETLALNETATQRSVRCGTVRELCN